MRHRVLYGLGNSLQKGYEIEPLSSRLGNALPCSLLGVSAHLRTLQPRDPPNNSTFLVWTTPLAVPTIGRVPSERPASNRRAARTPCQELDVSNNARTPEELETLFEDSLLLRDGVALSQLFDGGSTFVAHDGGTARGGAEIARLALTTCNGNAAYVA